MRWWLAAGVAMMLATGSAVATPIDEHLPGDDYLDDRVEENNVSAVDDYPKDYKQSGKTVPQAWLFGRLSHFVDPDIYRLYADDSDVSVIKRGDGVKTPFRLRKKGDRTNFRLRRKRVVTGQDDHYAWRFKRNNQKDNHEYFRLR